MKKLITLAILSVGLLLTTCTSSSTKVVTDSTVVKTDTTIVVVDSTK